MTPQQQQQKILDVVWQSGGFTFGGTSRDLIRGETPNDLDVRVGQDIVPTFLALGGKVINNPNKVTHGEAYYDMRLVFPAGLNVDIKYGWCSVTDIDVNLLRIYKDKVNLLYIPQHLAKAANPIYQIIHNCLNKQFVTLQECEPHRQYRWKEFVDRGWTQI